MEYKIDSSDEYCMVASELETIAPSAKPHRDDLKAPPSTVYTRRVSSVKSRAAIPIAPKPSSHPRAWAMACAPVTGTKQHKPQTERKKMSSIPYPSSNILSSASAFGDDESFLPANLTITGNQSLVSVAAPIPLHFISVPILFSASTNPAGTLPGPIYNLLTDVVQSVQSGFTNDGTIITYVGESAATFKVELSVVIQPQPPGRPLANGVVGITVNDVLISDEAGAWYTIPRVSNTASDGGQMTISTRIITLNPTDYINILITDLSSNPNTLYINLGVGSVGAYSATINITQLP